MENAKDTQTKKRRGRPPITDDKDMKIVCVSMKLTEEEHERLKAVRKIKLASTRRLFLVGLKMLIASDPELKHLSQ